VVAARGLLERLLISHRSLDALRNGAGHFHVLAVDHRDSLRVFLDANEPDAVPDSLLVDVKRDLVEHVSPYATGVMLEPEYSIPQALDVLSPTVGFIAALESQGYLADPSASATTLFWSVEEAAQSGAAAVKLLLPYHPEHPLAVEQRRVAAAVVGECHSVGIPLILEPLFHSLATHEARELIVYRTVEHFADSGADLLKLPFPVDPGDQVSEMRTVEACARITNRCHQPWALLSGGGTFESFRQQVSLATSAGAAGFMVGRALWGEAARAIDGDRRRLIINDVVLPRWQSLVAAASGETLIVN